MKIRIGPSSKRIWNAQLVFRKSANCNQTFTACKMGCVSVFFGKANSLDYIQVWVKNITSVRRSFGTTFSLKHPHDVPSQLIRKVCRSVRSRFEMLQLERGGRFEHKKQVNLQWWSLVQNKLALIKDHFLFSCLFCKMSVECIYV